MKVIVLGGGKIGYFLTNTLLEHGHEPRLIEINKELCKDVANKLDIPIFCGDGTDVNMLISAGIEDCDALIAVTGQDEDNLIACQIAKKHFKVNKTVARVNNPKNAQIMKMLGVDIPISSTDNIARLLEREVDSAAIKQLMSLNAGQASLSELQLPNKYILDGIKLSELKLPQDCIIVSISRGGEIIIPRGNTEIRGGDKIIVMSSDKTVHHLSKILHLND